MYGHSDNLLNNNVAYQIPKGGGGVGSINPFPSLVPRWGCDFACTSCDCGCVLQESLESTMAYLPLVSEGA